jgi:hypothetical protein
MPNSKLPNWCYLDGKLYFLTPDDLDARASKDPLSVAQVVAHHPDLQTRGLAAHALARLSPERLSEPIVEATLDALNLVTIRTPTLCLGLSLLFKKAAGTDTVKAALGKFGAAKRYRLKTLRGTECILNSEGKWVQMCGGIRCPRSAVRASGPSMRRSGSQRRNH